MPLLAPVCGERLGWINVKNFGARGNGTTDDTAAITAAIAALPTSGGVLYFPSSTGAYKTTGGFTLSKPCIVRGDGMTDTNNQTALSSTITCTSATATLFTVSASWARFENIVLKNTAGTTPTAGAGILVTSSYIAQKVDYESIHVGGFYICIDVQVGCSWVMHGCTIWDPVLYGVRIQNTVNGDGGDWAISDGSFISDTHASLAALYILSAGGGKIVNCKINVHAGFPFQEGIKVFPSAATSDLLIANCSIENCSQHGILWGDGTHPGSWNNIVISGCQIFVGGQPIALWASAAHPLSSVAISNCVITCAAGLSSIYLIYVNHASIATIETTQQTTFPVVNQSNCTFINDYTMGLQTTLNGTTAGTAVSSQPQRLANHKKVLVALAGYQNGTGSAQQVTYPVPFSTVAAITKDDSGGSTASLSALTLPVSMGTAKTGVVIVEGY